MARFMLSGRWMFFSSTTVTSMPQSCVWTSRISRMFWLIVSGFRQRLIERVAPDDGTERGLGDLVDRGGDVLDGHHRAHDLGDPAGTDWKARKGRWAVSIHIGPAGSATSAVLQALLAAFADAYVSTAHRDDPASGCGVAALGTDMPRVGGPAQEAYRVQVERYLAHLQPLLGDDDARRRATVTLSAMVGAVMIARALG
jgi:hypothetical protein